jgi:hypothetical protein
MFDVVDEERIHPRTLSDTALWSELAEISEVEARNKSRVTLIIREAEDRGAWKRAGFSSLAAWYAQAFRCDHRVALQVTETALALRSLPAMAEALDSGELTLDQVAAATPYATPDSDARSPAWRSDWRRGRLRVPRVRSSRRPLRTIRLCVAAAP